MKTNSFSYVLKNNRAHFGNFLIYQGLDGGVYMRMGKNLALLSLQQVKDLKLPYSKLPEFDQLKFLQFYAGSTGLSDSFTFKPWKNTATMLANSSILRPSLN